MIVYLVEQMDYDGTIIIAVCKTKEIAEKLRDYYIKNHPHDCLANISNIEIKSVEMNKVIE